MRDHKSQLQGQRIRQTMTFLQHIRPIQQRLHIRSTCGGLFYILRHLTDGATHHNDITPVSSPAGVALHFDNRAPRHLPIDEETNNYPREVLGACFAKVAPVPVIKPELVVSSAQALRLLDLDKDYTSRKINYFCGNDVPPGAETLAHCYSGHQYGLFSGQLGDGANMYIGEVLNSKKERWELQLKGGGPTPFSRAATDGRKVLRSSIREFICSEAMHHFGVPTTRAVSCVTSMTSVWRDIYYDGQKTEEKATLVVRMAPSFLRIGSLEICKTSDPDTGKAGPSCGNRDLLQCIMDYTISSFYPQISQTMASAEERYLMFYEELVRKTARLVAKWQAVGFCHGVINTDNISLVGVTLDYGPFAFMQTYDPDFICNSSDYWGRYCFRHQPEMLCWGLEKLCEVLQQILPTSRLLSGLEEFDTEYENEYLALMRKKLGLLMGDKNDRALVDDLLQTMLRTGSDYNKTFRCLSNLSFSDFHGNPVDMEVMTLKLLKNCCSLAEMKHHYRRRQYADSSEIVRSLWVLQTNPEILPKYVEANRRAVDQLNSRQMVAELQHLTEAEKKVADRACWERWLRKYIARLSLESTATQVEETAIWHRRQGIMKTINPSFVPHNYIIQQGIEEAESGDYTFVRNLLKIVENPFQPEEEQHKTDNNDPTISRIRKLYDRGPTEDNIKLRIT